VNVKRAELVKLREIHSKESNSPGVWLFIASHLHYMYIYLVQVHTSVLEKLYSITEGAESGLI
jgi:hypothetical protein